jgi:hypothetical protein
MVWLRRRRASCHRRMGKARLSSETSHYLEAARHDGDPCEAAELRTLSEHMLSAICAAVGSTPHWTSPPSRISSRSTSARRSCSWSDRQRTPTKAQLELLASAAGERVRLGRPARLPAARLSGRRPRDVASPEPGAPRPRPLRAGGLDAVLHNRTSAAAERNDLLHARAEVTRQLLVRLVDDDAAPPRPDGARFGRLGSTRLNGQTDDRRPRTNVASPSQK